MFSNTAFRARDVVQLTRFLAGLYALNDCCFRVFGAKALVRLCCGGSSHRILRLYGYGNLTALLLLSASIIFNYAIGTVIDVSARQKRTWLARSLVAIGVAANLSFLGYFKYAEFLITNLYELTGVDAEVATIALPIGISFYTFTQIAFFVDLFHHRLPQFERMARYGWDTTALAVGVSLFSIGLFKKTAIADSVAPFADVMFDRAATENIPMLASWIGALAYSFQIYFDFSRYSDMAIGLSLLFGVRLPLNCASPYKATSIIEFWSRWHISLSQFLRDYLYIPLGGNWKGPTRRYARCRNGPCSE